MNDMRQAFMADIIACPADDAPRLIFADWLEDNGEPERAEFIRTQTALAQHGAGLRGDGRRSSVWPGYMTPSKRSAAERREHQLLSAPLDPQTAAFAWSQPIHSTGIALGRRLSDVITFRRGFVAEVRCTLADWLGHGGAICAAHPIERVELTDRRPAEVNEKFFWWAAGEESYFPSELPLMIWSLIDLPSVRNYWKASPTRDGAVDALSAALIKWGRQ